MVGWHHRLNEHESEQTPGSSEGPGSLAGCHPWGHTELDTTERLNNNKPLVSSPAPPPHPHLTEIRALYLSRCYHLMGPHLMNLPTCKFDYISSAHLTLVCLGSLTTLFCPFSPLIPTFLPLQKCGCVCSAEGGKGESGGACVQGEGVRTARAHRGVGSSASPLM